MDKYYLLSEIREKLQDTDEAPIVLCIGSNKVSGDCLGPMVGHLLVEKYKVKTFVYGTMKDPVTAWNIEEVARFISAMHQGAPVLAIDAAVGHLDSIGKIKVYNDGIYPGLATGKVISKVGTHSIIGIVEEQSYLSATLLTQTKLQFVYDMARIIADSVNDFVMMHQTMKILQ